MAIIDFKATKCRHCYKCVRNCEVKAIMVKDGRAEIMPENCILCGRCLQICPQSAKTLVSDLSLVKGMIEAGEKVVISIAPSYMGLLKYHTIGQVRCALMRLGFTDVRETAEGAALVTAEYAKLLSEGTRENIISTCCPSVNALIEKYYPKLIPYLAPVVSPMIAHGRMIKQQMGADTRVVFLGPCIAKKQEALDPRHADCIDAVLNFNDISRWLNEEDILIEDCEDTPFERMDPRVNRLYPVTSGVISSVVATQSKQDRYRKFYVHGESNCIDLCQSMVRGEITGCFIEMNMCSGGCIKGPTVHDRSISRFKVKLDMEEQIGRESVPEKETAPVLEAVSLNKVFFDRTPHEPVPSEAEIRQILAKTGKMRPDDELNCGACGYPTCREKAIAVFQKKAEVDMCIPYLHDRAQSLSHLVMDTSPNLIMIIDDDMRIRECSVAAEMYFGVKPEAIKGKPLEDFINAEDVREVFRTHTSVHSRKVIYPDRNLVTLQNIAYIDDGNFVIATIIDVTREEKQAKQEYAKKKATIDLAQNVIYKQMMVAQNIAGLLGETTAETKTTLMKLCSLIDDESESEVR